LYPNAGACSPWEDQQVAFVTRRTLHPRREFPSFPRCSPNHTHLWFVSQTAQPLSSCPFIPPVFHTRSSCLKLLPPFIASVVTPAHLLRPIIAPVCHAHSSCPYVTSVCQTPPRSPRLLSTHQSLVTFFPFQNGHVLDDPRYLR
jgi:hypothetical protein